MAIGTVTSKGQVTIPKAIRDRAGIEPGTRLRFEVAKKGGLRVEVTPSGAGSLFGALREFAPAKPVTVAEMNSAIRRRVSERQARALRSK